MRKNYVYTSNFRSLIFMSAFVIGFMSLGISYGQDAIAPFELGINCGGDEYTTADGVIYLADTYHDDVGATWGNSPDDIIGTEDDILYETLRYPFAYTIPVENGQYSVTLKMAEVYWAASEGMRVGNYYIQGEEVLSNFDVLAHVGLYTALDTTFIVQVTNGELSISSDDGLIISAIFIEKVPPITIGINCGGDEYTTADGVVYLADTLYTRGNAWSNNNATIEGTDDGTLYKSERYNFAYTIPVQNGEYSVTLKMAEIYWRASEGSRVGNYYIQGDTVLSNFDMLANAPMYTAIDRTFIVEVTNGELTISTDTDMVLCAILIETVEPGFLSLKANVENGTITMEPGGGSYAAGTEVTVTVDPDYGFELTEWTGDLEGVEDSTSTSITVLMDTAKTITAELEQLTMFTFESNAEHGQITVLPEERDSYVAGTEVTITIDPDYGFELTEWTGDLEGVEDSTATSITVLMDQDRSITAEMKESPMFVLTTNIENGNIYIDPAPDADGGMYYKGAEVQLTAQPHAGYVFKGWSGDVSGDEKTIKVVVDKDMDATALIELNIFPLTIDATNGSVQTLPKSGDEFEGGTDLILQAIPDDGYQFSHWEGDISGEQNPTSLTMDSAIHVTAVFTEIKDTYQLTTDASNGSVSMDPEPADANGTYDDGTVVTVTAIPDEGYEFIEWGGDLSGSENPTTITVDGDKTLTAVFDEITSTGVIQSDKETGLGQNYPNPFSVQTTIPYHLDEAAHVKLTVYNIIGEKVNTLVNTRQKAGSYTIEWNVTDLNGQRLFNGIYFYQLVVDDGLVKIQKAVISQ